METRKREVGTRREMRMVKWKTYTNICIQTQAEMPSHTERYRPCAMRPFFIVIVTGPRELSANTADLYRGSPLQREKVCVCVCVCARV